MPISYSHPAESIVVRRLLDITVTACDAALTRPDHSFLPPDGGLAPPETEFGTFGQEFGSGDGWLGHASGKDLALFHFWGCEETQEPSCSM